jgi:hypothetical protein
LVEEGFEARCWVLRNRAWTRMGSGLVFQGSRSDLLWVGGWLGPAFTKPLVWVFVLGVLSLGWVLVLVGGGSGWFLPVF